MIWHKRTIQHAHSYTARRYRKLPHIRFLLTLNRRKIANKKYDRGRRHETWNCATKRNPQRLTPYIKSVTNRSSHPTTMAVKQFHLKCNSVYRMTIKECVEVGRCVYVLWFPRQYSKECVAQTELNKLESSCRWQNTSLHFGKHYCHIIFKSTLEFYTTHFFRNQHILSIEQRANFVRMLL